jgi:hypothetical protein
LEPKKIGKFGHFLEPDKFGTFLAESVYFGQPLSFQKSVQNEQILIKLSSCLKPTQMNCKIIFGYFKTSVC